MAKIKVKIKDPEGGAFKQPTPGLYTAKVHKIVEETSKAGNDMLTVSLKITNRRGPQKEFKGTVVRSWVALTEAAEFKLVEFLKACGVKVKKGDISFDTDKLIGTEVQIKIEGGTYNGDYSASVARIIPISEDVEDEDDGEEDDDDAADDDDLEEGDEEEEDDDDPEDEADEEEEDDEEIDLDDLNLKELRALASERKVKLRKEDKAGAIRKKLRAAEAAAAEAEEEEEDGDGDDYNDWSLADLREEAEARGLEFSEKARKPKLVKLLVEDDEENEDPFG